MKCPNCGSKTWYFGLHMDIWCKNIQCIHGRNKNGLYFWFSIGGDDEVVSFVKENNFEISPLKEEGYSTIFHKHKPISDIKFLEYMLRKSIPNIYYEKWSKEQIDEHVKKMIVKTQERYRILK